MKATVKLQEHHTWVLFHSIGPRLRAAGNNVGHFRPKAISQPVWGTNKPGGNSVTTNHHDKVEKDLKD